MIINSFLVQGAGAALVARLASLSSPSLDALVLLSLGVDQSILLDAVRQNDIKCPVYLSETYGILGFDEDLKKNIELMEKGRGSEYGCVGGSGGQGCLAIGYSGGNIVSGTNADFPSDISNIMVIADQSGSWKKDKAKAPLHYGGITKQAWKVVDNKLEEVPYFWIGERSSTPTGVCTFKGDAADATKSLLSKLPSGYKTSGSIGLFPCFTRGVNEYGAENVESDAIGTVIKDPHHLRIYGMFAHGELGPSSFADFTKEAGNCIECDQHGMTSILSIHTTKE